MVLRTSAVSDELIPNLRLAMAIELATLPPYLYAYWSVRPRSEGGSAAGEVAAGVIRSVVYEEMLHFALAANVLKAVGGAPRVTEHLVRYPGPLPGHDQDPPYGYTVGLEPLSVGAVRTFVRIEAPQWSEHDPAAPREEDGWITIGGFYRKVKQQLGRYAGPFSPAGQFAAIDTPSPGEIVCVRDLESARHAIDIICDQGEGHAPADREDDEHELTHYWKFKELAAALRRREIDPERDVWPVVANPDASAYGPEQKAADRAFNRLYSLLLDALQDSISSDRPRVFGVPSELMLQLEHAAAVLRRTGPIPGTALLPGPTFRYLPPTER